MATPPPALAPAAMSVKMGALTAIKEAIEVLTEGTEAPDEYAEVWPSSLMHSVVSCLYFGFSPFIQKVHVLHQYKVPLIGPTQLLPHRMLPSDYSSLFLFFPPIPVPSSSP